MKIYYAKSHEWIAVDGETGTVGITDHAQEQLGDLVFIELPEVGTEIEADGQIATVESVKAASEIYSPVAGQVSEVNAALAENPALINEDAEGQGWFFRVTIKDRSQLDNLMDKKAYERFVETLS